MGIRTKFNSMGNTGDTAWDEKTLRFSVRLSETTVNLTPKNSTTYINPITVYWGDGTSNEYSSGEITHTYSSTSGLYTIRIYSETGKMPFISFCYYDSNFADIYFDTPLLECYNGNTPETDFYNIFNHLGDITMPKQFFIKNPQITSFNNAFSFSEFDILPEDLFDYTPNVEDMTQCFYWMNGGTFNIPNGFFDNLTNVTTFEECFSLSNVLSIPSDLFNNLLNVTNLSNCFNQCKYITGNLPELWNLYPNLSDYDIDDCFYGCTSASNYKNVPYNWGGPTSCTINPTPSDATVNFTFELSNTFNLIEGNTAYAGPYDAIMYTVHKEGYSTVSGTVSRGSYNIDVTLKERNIPFSINTTPSNAQVIIESDGTTETTNSILVSSGAIVKYTVSKEGYNTKTGEVVVNEATTISVELRPRLELINISYPFTTEGIDFSTVLTNFMIDDSSKSIKNTNNYGGTGYIKIPAITGYDNISININGDYNGAWYTCYGAYLGTQIYNLSYYNITNGNTDGNGEYIFRFYDSADIPATNTFTYFKNLNSNTDYYINMYSDNDNNTNYYMRLYSAIVGADLPENTPLRTIQINTNVSDATVTFNYLGETITASSIEAYEGLKVTYTVTKEGYKTVKNTITVTQDETIQINLEETLASDINLIYPFNDQYGVLNNLVNNNVYIISDSLNAIVSNSSYNVDSGTSYGYIKIETEDSTQLVLEGYVSSESNCDYGAVYIGTSVYQPTQSQLRNGTTDGNGEYIFIQSGTNNANTTYTYNLEANKTYYLSFAYAKDFSSNRGEDRLIITKIQYTGIVQ